MNEFLSMLTHLPAAFWVWLAGFGGSTVHAFRNRAIPAKEGLVGIYCALLFSVFALYGLCWWREWEMEEVWWLTFFLALMANYLIGGMEGEGKKLQRSLVGRLVELLNVWLTANKSINESSVTKTNIES